MTSDLSSQFVEYLRQSKHLTAVDGRSDASRAGRIRSPGQALGACRSVGQRIRRRSGALPRARARHAAGHDVGGAAGGIVLATLPARDDGLSVSVRRWPRRARGCRPDRHGGAARGANRARRRRRDQGRDVGGPRGRPRPAARTKTTSRRPAAPAAQPREDDIESLRDLASGAPVVRAVNDLLEKAVELRASDIHIEPFHTGLVVRMRIDGLLRPVTAPAGVLPQAVISRIKIVANLNIAERRLPQDGAARLRAGRTDIDIRVAIMPTQHGESAVIRILPKDRGLLVVEKLGFSSPDEATLRRLLKLPHGMIVITGPTGSGKTTTLATILSILNEPVRKILTIEDPGRIRNSRHQPVADQAGDRTDIRRGAALVRAPGPRRHHGRRSPRLRDRACRGSCRAHRASGADDAAYRNGGGGGAAPARSRRRRLSAAIGPARGDRAAAGSPVVRTLQVVAGR